MKLQIKWSWIVIATLLWGADKLIAHPASILLGILGVSAVVVAFNIKSS